MIDYAAQIAALVEALGSGEKTVKVNGREVTYRDVSEIRAAIATLKAMQADDPASAGADGRYATTVAVFGND